MKKKIACLALFAHFFVGAQSQNIEFRGNSTWGAVLEKAKRENKFIFIDCYATWCGPCKQMDETVFLNDTVASFINQGFVPVKLQMDRTAHDSANVRNWYGFADSIERFAQVRAYPTYLFVSPDGILVHKHIGMMSVTDFLALANNVRDPNLQYYTLLGQYQHGGMPLDRVERLAKMSKDLGYDSLSTAIARDYILRYIEPMGSDKMWTRDNLDFINEFRQAVRSDDIIFKKYVEQKALIDSIMEKKGYSDGLINYMIIHEEISAPVEAGIRNRIEPGWAKIEKTLEKKYGKSYSYDVLKARVKYYKAMKEWAKYSTYFVRQMNLIKIETFSKEASTMINNSAAEVFQYSENKRELEYALAWINHAISLHPDPDANELDTKANILYKLHRVKEAILLEQQSARLAPDDKEIQDAYAKMKKGERTWNF